MAIFRTIERRNYRAAVDNCAKFEATAKRILDKAEADGRDLTEAEREDIDRLMGKMAASQSTLDAFRLRVDESLEAVIEREENERLASDRKALAAAKSGESRGAIFESMEAQLAAIVEAGRPGGRVDEKLHRVSERFAAGVNSGVGSEGGFLLEPTFANVILRGAYEQAPVASRCFRPPLGQNSNGIIIPMVDESSRANGSRWGGVRVYRTSEGGAITETKPKFRRLELKLKKLAGLCYASDEMLQDSAALALVIQQGFTEELAFTLDDEIIRGVGAGQMLGVLASSALVTVSKESEQTADSLAFSNLLKMWSRMWARSRKNAVWFINQDIEPQLYSLSLTIGDAGVPVYLPPSGASKEPYATLMGRPVIPIEQASTVGDVGDVILADMSQYCLIDKPAKMDSSIHVRFVYDEQAFRFTYRCDGAPLWSTPLTPAQGTNTVSPFVTLEAR